MSDDYRIYRNTRKHAQSLNKMARALDRIFYDHVKAEKEQQRLWDAHVNHKEKEAKDG